MSDAIDRITPRHRPTGCSRRLPIGTQRWSTILFLHWEVDVDNLRSLVPSTFELDLFEGKAYVGCVPFRMEDVRSPLMPFGFDFHEMNLRTYITYNGEPGVYFFSLDAASPFFVKVLRGIFGMPYEVAKMSSSMGRPPVNISCSRASTQKLPFHIPDGLVKYSSVRSSNGASLEVTYVVGDELDESEPGSLQFFLCERYYLFTLQPSGVYKAQVHHSPYKVRSAQTQELKETLLSTTGLEAKSPPLVHFSEGVNVPSFGPWRIGPTDYGRLWDFPFIFIDCVMSCFRPIILPHERNGSKRA